MFIFKRLRPSFLFICTLFMLSTSNSRAADTSNDMMMNLTILGAIGSLGYACYEGKGPCSLDPLNTDRLTLSLDVGADNSTHNERIALGADWHEALFESKHFEINGRWEVNINRWHSSKKHPVNKSGYIVGLTPVFNYTWKTGSVKPFLELGGGPQYLSDVTIENEFKSTQFQFGSILGLGIQTDRFEIGYRYLHISNANIELPNPGTDFHNLHLGLKF